MWKFITLILTFVAGYFLGYKKTIKFDDDIDIDSKCVVFQFDAVDASNVAIAGTFNNWDPSHDKLFNLGNGKWGITLYLEPGRYEYKFVIDGNDWVEDPNAIEFVDDGYGGKRSVIFVE